MKYLTVVAFVLLVLTGAMGLRNIASTHGAAGSGISAPAYFAQGGPFPPYNPGGPGH
jgi:hypothetical protein